MGSTLTWNWIQMNQQPSWTCETKSGRYLTNAARGGIVSRSWYFPYQVHFGRVSVFPLNKVFLMTFHGFSVTRMTHDRALSTSILNNSNWKRRILNNKIFVVARWENSSLLVWPKKRRHQNLRTSSGRRRRIITNNQVERQETTLLLLLL